MKMKTNFLSSSLNLICLTIFLTSTELAFTNGKPVSSHPHPSQKKGKGKGFPPSHPSHSSQHPSPPSKSYSDNGSSKNGNGGLPQKSIDSSMKKQTQPLPSQKSYMHQKNPSTLHPHLPPHSMYSKSNPKAPPSSTEMESVHRENYSWASLEDHSEDYAEWYNSFEEDVDEWWDSVEDDISEWWDSVENEYEEMYHYVEDWYGNYWEEEMEPIEVLSVEEATPSTSSSSSSLPGQYNKYESPYLKEGSYASKWVNNLSEDEKEAYASKYNDYIDKSISHPPVSHLPPSASTSHDHENQQQYYIKNSHSYYGSYNEYFKSYKKLALEASKASGGTYTSLDTINENELTPEEEEEGIEDHPDTEDYKLFTVESFSKKIDQDVQNMKKYYEIEWNKLSVEEQSEIKSEYEDYINYYNTHKEEIHQIIEETKMEYRQQYQELPEEQKQVINVRFNELQHYLTLTDKGSEGYGEGVVMTKNYGKISCRSLSFWGQCGREEVAGFCDQSCYLKTGYTDSKGDKVEPPSNDSEKMETFTMVAYFATPETYSHVEDMYANYEMEMNNLMQHYKKQYYKAHPDASIEDIADDFEELAEYAVTKGEEQYINYYQETTGNEIHFDEGEPHPPIISPAEAQLKEVMHYYSSMYGDNSEIDMEELYEKWNHKHEEEINNLQQSFKKEMERYQNNMQEAIKQTEEMKAKLDSNFNENANNKDTNASGNDNSLHTLGDESSLSNPYAPLCYDEPNTAYVRVKVGTALVGSSCLLKGNANPYVTLRMGTHEGKTNTGSRAVANWDKTFNLDCQNPGRQLYVNLYNKLNNKLCGSWVIDDWDDGKVKYKNQRELAAPITTAAAGGIISDYPSTNQPPTGSGILKPDVQIGEVISFNDDGKANSKIADLDPVTSQIAIESTQADVQAAYRLTTYGINNKYVNVDDKNPATKKALAASATDTTTLTLEVMVYGADNLETEDMDDQYEPMANENVEKTIKYSLIFIIILLCICATTILCHYYQRQKVKKAAAQTKHQRNLGFHEDEETGLNYGANHNSSSTSTSTTYNNNTSFNVQPSAPFAPSAPNVPMAHAVQASSQSSPRWFEYFGEILTARPSSPQSNGTNQQHHLSGTDRHSQDIHSQQQAKY